MASVPTTAIFFFSSSRRHTRYWRDWSSDVCSSDLLRVLRQVYEVKGEKARAKVRMPAGLPELLSATFSKEVASLAMRQVAADGTSKLLLRLSDGRTVESEIGRASCRERV